MENPMSASARISNPLSHLAMAALAAIITGCASTPPPASAGSPASAAELRDMAIFTKLAQDEGWTPIIRRGQVLYCQHEMSLGSHLPAATCLDKPGLQRMMLAEERQRQRLQLPYAAAGCAALPCK